MPVTCKANGKMQRCHATAAEDTVRHFTKIGFPVLRFNGVNRHVLTARKVPLEVIEQSQDRPFAALVLDVKAVTQITGSFP